MSDICQYCGGELIKELDDVVECHGFREVYSYYCPTCDEAAQHRLHTDAATVVHKEWCIGGDKGPCNCGAEQDRRAGKANPLARHL